MPEKMKKVFMGVRNEIVNLADDALRWGAGNLGNELANMKVDLKQSDAKFRAITNALKSGVMATGQELMTRGMERMGISPQEQQRMGISPQKKKSQMYEESTLTQE